ncbi:MAG TPA: response regulator transcription factor [Marmoricola sp.]|nr:response regulator transcription factor [Marmoricola sp.]
MSASSGSGLRVLVVDSNELFRRGLAALLSTLNDVAVASSAPHLQSAVELAEAGEFDIVVVDVSLGQDSGIGLCERVKELQPEVKVVMLTASESGADLYDSVQAGASGYLLKSSSFNEVAEAIRAVVRGQSMISPVMASKLLEEFRRASDPDPEASRRRRLSDRELEVLRLVARGMNNRDVAKALAISENTVKNHMRSILDKLKLRSRTEAAMYAVRENLVEAQ